MNGYQPKKLAKIVCICTFARIAGQKKKIVEVGKRAYHQKQCIYATKKRVKIVAVMKKIAAILQK